MTARKYHALHQSSLYRMPTKSRLADLLLVTKKDLQFLSKSDSLYCHFPVPKKDGTTRMVDNPCPQLKRVQKRIANLLGRISPPDALFCPVKGRSYVDNAARHRNGRVIRSLDIQKYFPSTPRRRVFWFFRTVMDCPRDVASILASLACCDGHLATGSPVSPILAYYAYFDVWERIASLAKEHGCALSIYVDDITLSGPSVTDKLMWDVTKCIHGAGLRYHKEKRSIDRACEVTGVIVNRGELAAPHRQHWKLREAKRAMNNDCGPNDRTRIVGRVAGLQGVFEQIANGNAGISKA